jgi:hypothetical protein
MPRGDKSAYTDKQKRQAKHIEDSEKKSGRSGKDAARIAWATVNKQDGGGLKAKTKSSMSPKQVSGDKSSTKKTDDKPESKGKAPMGKTKDSDKRTSKKSR